MQRAKPDMRFGDSKGQYDLLITRPRVRLFLYLDKYNIHNNKTQQNATKALTRNSGSDIFKMQQEEMSATIYEMWRLIWILR